MATCQMNSKLNSKHDSNKNKQEIISCICASIVATIGARRRWNFMRLRIDFNIRLHAVDLVHMIKEVD